MEDMTEVRNALENFVEVWGHGPLAFEIAGGLNCIEVGALARLLTAVGASDRAEVWIEEHGYSDGCDDSHCQCDDPECIEARLRES